MKKSALQILFTDPHYIVIYKPNGLLSISYEGNTAKTALDMLTAMLRSQGKVNTRTRPAVVHRLDRETSGLMLFALHSEAKKRMMNSWQTVVKKRTYRAVCEIPQNTAFTYLPEKIYTICKPLTYNAQNRAYVAERPTQNQLEAITHFKVIGANDRFALLELELETGRKNQIRAHLAHEGFPIAGDKEYRSKTNPFNRLALHARALSFVHPFTHKVLEFEYAEPKEWTTITQKNALYKS